MTQYPIVGVSPEELGGYPDYVLSPVWFIRDEEKLLWTWDDKWSLGSLKVVKPGEDSFMKKVQSSVSIEENEHLYLVSESLMLKMDALEYIGFIEENPLHDVFSTLFSEIGFYAATMAQAEVITRIDSVCSVLWESIATELGRDSKTLRNAYELYQSLAIGYVDTRQYILNKAVFLTFHGSQDSKELTSMGQHQGTLLFLEGEDFDEALIHELTKYDVDAITARMKSN